ncbi:pantoate--beta-alanine ligase [Riemerella columbipharyngis]|uniref:Pantothenate synthetase n=1 Tax=Riemerella columbipharyngis TaxID=1071918 RepID=A0A1G7B5Y2_9FLAO|nr:pantoate--beta-alanine ligase [Riemerella columbipharyngis]SDE22413.1 pantoate--beta-alanine ligase [Riemerella columbipharyngis]
MKVISDKKRLEKYIETIKKNKKTIGFAPTMGALHDGHISLYQKARPENDIVVSSIFVNPTQFNNAEDLEKYPRTIDEDLKKLENSGLVDAVYTPSIEDIYPNEAVSRHYDFDGLENEMEGKMRPGHFDGVGTVVEELFRQVQPDNAYFGEKDFQQLAIIKKLVEKKHLPIKIVGVPIYREKKGLAMSSRNQRLSETIHKEANIIYESLSDAKEWAKNLSLPEIKKRIEERFNSLTNFELEYFTIANEKTLKEAKIGDNSDELRMFIVVHTEGVRLIDNMKLT